MADNSIEQGSPKEQSGAPERDRDLERDRVLNRLARIEGQVRGLQRMIEEDKECEQILMQLAAARSALDNVGTYLISYRMKECMREEGGVDIDPAALEKAFEVFFKYVQCVR